MNRLLDFFEKCGVTSWNFSVLEPRAGGGESCMKGHDRPRGREEVEKCIKWGRARNQAGFNVYIRPARYLAGGEPASWPMVFLDDLTPEVAYKISKKYKAAVVETSENNCQIWISCNRFLWERERWAVQADIIKKIGADKGSSSGEHWGRAPGFRNKKPDRKNEVVKVLQISLDRPAYSPAIKNEGVAVLPQGGACVLRPPAGAAPFAKVSGGGGGGDSQESHKEFKFACESLRRRVGRDAIINNIAMRALGRGKRRTAAAAEQYAARTVDAAAIAILQRRV